MLSGPLPVLNGMPDIRTWRCSDSLSLRDFLAIPPGEQSPDHSSLSKIRDRLPLQLHLDVFAKILKLADEKKLLKGKSVAVDSTTLEADAAMKSIVQRDNGDDWKQYVTRLMQEQGVVAKDQQPTDEELRRYDKNRKNKKVSNEEWVSPTDPDSRIARMKDGTTHLAYKAEHVVDLDTNLILAAESLSCQSVRSAERSKIGVDLAASSMRRMRGTIARYHLSEKCQRSGGTHGNTHKILETVEGRPRPIL